LPQPGSTAPLRIRKLESLDLPELQPYRTMRRQLAHREAGIFIAEGEKVVRRLLQSRFRVESVLLPPKWLEDLRPLLQTRADELRAYVAEKEVLERLTGFSMYQGLLALGKVPPQPAPQAILTAAQKPLLLAAADGLSSAENLGVLVRNCAAFGVAGLLVGETCASPYLRRAVRSSMGAVFELPIMENMDLAQTLTELKAGGIRCIAAHPHAAMSSLSRGQFRAACCIVFGSEGYGISAPVLQMCDEAAAIPMPPTVDSLNVGSASAVFLYEANRQRGRM
jgi:tRNA G18 (ribose-2'-O)-methylase SpoU